MFEQSSREEVDKALGCGTFSVAERGFEPDGIDPLLGKVQHVLKGALLCTLGIPHSGCFFF